MRTPEQYERDKAADDELCRWEEGVMNGATKEEMAEFKRMKDAERAAVTNDDAKAVKAMVAAWVKAAPNPTAHQRRRAMARCVRFAHSEF